MQFATFVDILGTVILCTSSGSVLAHLNASLPSYGVDSVVRVRAVLLIQSPYG